MAVIENNLFNEIQNILSGENVYAVTDKNVFALYPEVFGGVKNMYVVRAGEDSKSLTTLSDIASDMFKKGCDRKTLLVAVGGGVVGDLAGFTAAVFMRGIKWINVPTTLLAQCDSGVGGKTGVNLDDYKNAIGAFHNPSEVYISLEFLKTLPERERLCGLGEVIKTALLDKNFSEFLEINIAKLISFDDTAILEAVKRCVEFKEYVVKTDPTETTGLRKILNAGHTVGHALEREDKHRLSHGEYVLWGMFLETYICRNFMPAAQYLYLVGILKRALKGKTINFDPTRVAASALGDKKNQNGRISIIAIIDKGEQREYYFTQKEIEEGLKSWINEYGK